MNIQTQKIEDIRKRYDHEWLLIAVDQMNEATSTPLTGRLLAHNPDPLEIHKVAMRHDGFLATIYSNDWPEDLAACFYDQIST
ncbi:MAG: hypothetical protein HY587_02720 [Candidatus Omnitrophica bacterium]|nr:hypothetical protein [Candidatus Omnitrophota bacterium]